MSERKIISRIDVWSHIKEIIAYAIRSELTGKSTNELINMLEKKRLLTLKKALAEEELVRRGIDVLSKYKSDSQQSQNMSLNYQLDGSTLQSSSNGPNQSPAANIESSKFANYIKRHWRGEFELLESFWGNVVLINILTSAFVTLLLKAEYFGQFTQEYTKSVWFFSIIFVLAIYFLALWQLVGLWRSASNHIRMTNRRFWARFSKLFVILSTIGAVNQSTCYASTFIDNTKFAFGLTPFDKYEVTLVDGGTTLVVSGGIGYRLTEKVAKELTLYPDVRVIRLNSIGGRLSEGHRLRELIEQRGLSTYASHQCYSACAIAFIGGRERVLHKDAQLGFHQPSIGNQQNRCHSSTNALSDKKLRDIINKETHTLIDAGVDASFAKKAMSIPSDEIWRPTHEELFRAGIISRVTEDV